MLLHAYPSSRYALILKYTIFGIWIYKFVFDPLERLGDLPPELFQPRSILQFLPREWELLLVSHESLIGIRILGTITCILCLFPKFLRWVGPVCCAITFLHQCILRGFGHGNHAEIIALFSIWVYTAFAWMPPKRPNPEPLIISALFCIAYTLVGVHRLAHGGIELFLSDTLVYWCAYWSSSLSGFNFELGLLALEYEWFAWLLNLSFPIITILEALAPFSLINTRFRQLFLVSMFGFHIGTLLLMNIFFWENMILLLILFPLIDTKREPETPNHKRDKINSLDKIPHSS